MDEFRKSGERILNEMYWCLVGCLDGDDDMEWADDPAVWCEVFEEWANGLEGTPHAYSWEKWLDVADYIVGENGTEYPIYVGIARWLCKRWNDGHRAKHMRVDEHHREIEG